MLVPCLMNSCTDNHQAGTEWMKDDTTFAFLRVYQLQPRVDIDAAQTLSPSQSVYLQHLLGVLYASNSVQHIDLWKNGESGPSTRQMFKMLTEVSEYIRLAADVSIDSIVQNLGTKNIFDAGLFNKHEILEVAHRAVFVIVGALTMLYTTVEDKANITIVGLQVVIGNQRESPTKKQALRGLSEFLRKFGDVLPQNGPTTLHTESLPGFNATEGLILTTNMSLATICRIAKLEIHWVLCIGEHFTLDLTPERQRLSVFVLPSFCNVSMTDVSPFARQVFLFMDAHDYELTNHRVSDSFYEEWMKPQGMCGSKYAQEVLHTLLILLGTEKSRKLFKNKEIPSIKSLNLNYDLTFDQLNDDLQHKKVSLKESYSKTSDFPILAHRLELLEQYVNNQQPSRLMGLWKDDRDIMRWYTLWAVIGLGLFASIIAVLQVGIGIFQAVYAKKAYDSQAKTSPSSPGA